jgi:exodeoxyribonuclease VII large subunit
MAEIRPLSVSEVNRSIKSILLERKELKDIWIKGEISNYSPSGAGHIYFSLKDPTSVIRCTFFSFQNKNYKGKKLQDGMEVQVFGSINLYEPGGYYSVNVARVEELGKGDILYRIEKLKAELNAKGIFNIERKRPIPRFPKTLGIATSPNGAAVEDIIRIAKERYPNINILIAPCQVQGETAPSSIVSAIEELNNPKWEVDVIIAGRGGGSFEDLMPFNEEAVVMAYYNSRVPIISAVGHQIDSLLCDHAADAYVPTPTAGAELAVPEIEELENYLSDIQNRFNQSLKYKLDIARDRLHLISNKHIFLEPRMLLTDRIQRVDEILNRIFLLGKNNISTKKNLLQRFENITIHAKSVLSTKDKQFRLALGRVDSFSPLETLTRGYSVARNKKKEVIISPAQVKVGEELELILKDQKKIKVEVKEK